MSKKGVKSQQEHQHQPAQAQQQANQPQQERNSSDNNNNNNNTAPALAGPKAKRRRVSACGAPTAMRDQQRPSAEQQKQLPSCEANPAQSVERDKLTDHEVSLGLNGSSSPPTTVATNGKSEESGPPLGPNQGAHTISADPTGTSMSISNNIKTTTTTTTITTTTATTTTTTTSTTNSSSSSSSITSTIKSQANEKRQENICAACLQPIRERYLLMALDKQWHEDCLKCACCDCRLGEVGSSLFTHSNKILCRRDFLRIFGRQGNCAACERTIPPYELVMRANDNAYHLDCFSCQNCHYRFCVGDRFHLTQRHKVICVLCHSEAKQQVGAADSRSAVAAAANNISEPAGPDEHRPALPPTSELSIVGRKSQGAPMGAGGRPAGILDELAAGEA